MIYPNQGLRKSTEQFYKSFCVELRSVNRSVIIILIGDFNALMGSYNSGLKSTISRQGTLGERGYKYEKNAL